MGSTLTKPFNKSKNQFMAKTLHVSSTQKPIFRYILGNEEIINLIGKVSGFHKKNLEKLDNLLYADNYDDLLI